MITGMFGLALGIIIGRSYPAVKAWVAAKYKAVKAKL